MTVFYLVRHGDTDMVGQGIAGRRGGIHLNARGRIQAQAVARRLTDVGIEYIYASPLERTQETAEIIGAGLGLSVDVLYELIEIDFGEWTGRRFTELDGDAHWRRFNRLRSVTRIPNGEMMLEVQTRMVTAVERLRHIFPDTRVVIVSHGDPIRATIAYYTGMPLDLMQNIQVAPGSVSTLAVGDHGAQVRCLNHTGDTPAG